MDRNEYTGLEFMEGFTLLVGAIWIVGAIVLVVMVMMGQGRV